MKKSILFKLSCIVLSFVLLSSVFVKPAPVSAAKSIAELKKDIAAAQKRIDDAKTKQADAKKIQQELETHINAVQELIDECNILIYDYSSQVAAKQEQIDLHNEEIEKDKEQFKRRIRSIYMSNAENNIQFMLGADDFADYLTLAQLTKSVSAHDNTIIKNIVESAKAVASEQAGIQKLLDEQEGLKAEIAAQKSVYDARLAELNAELNKIQRDIAADTKAMNDAAAEIDKQSAASLGGGVNADLSFDGGFLWPSARFTYKSAFFDGDDPVHKGNHKGIDIAGGGISGTPVRAAASGTVYINSNTCGHNIPKNYSCGCGGGYGNYVAIDHGRDSSGKTYKTLYAHMKATAVKRGQYVQKGQIIGYVGTTGWSTGPHIHFETIVNGTKVNPERFKYEY